MSKSDGTALAPAMARKIELWPVSRHGAEAEAGEVTPEGERCLKMLRYAQSAEARELSPLEATLGEIDCLVELTAYHGMKLEDLVE